MCYRNAPTHADRKGSKPKPKAAQYRRPTAASLSRRPPDSRRPRLAPVPLWPTAALSRSAAAGHEEAALWCRSVSKKRPQMPTGVRKR